MTYLYGMLTDQRATLVPCLIPSGTPPLLSTSVIYSMQAALIPKQLLYTSSYMTGQQHHDDSLWVKCTWCAFAQAYWCIETINAAPSLVMLQQI